MIDGSTAPMPGERQLRQIQVQVLNSRWALVDPSWWRFHLFSPFWRLYRHQDRGVVIRCAGRSLALDPGTTWVIPAWVEFHAEAHAPVHQDYLHFTIAGVPPSLHRRLFDAPLALPTSSVLEGLVATWQRSLEGTTPSVQLDAPPPPPGRPAGPADFTWAMTMAHAAFATVLQHLPEPAALVCQAWLGDQDGIRPALDAIEGSLADPPRNEDLAALCGISPNQLIRRFRSALGMTPARYSLERRIALAAQYLSTGDEPLETIAERLGFVDRYHLSRVFARQLGMAPSAYRRGHALVDHRQSA